MPYENLLDCIARVIGYSLEALEATTTIGTSQKYEDITHLEYEEDCTAKIWIDMESLHSRATISGFSRNFLLDIEGQTDQAMETIVLAIEKFLATYIQENVADPIHIMGNIIDTSYDDDGVIYFHKMRITASWDWVRV